MVRAILMILVASKLHLFIVNIGQNRTTEVKENGRLLLLMMHNNRLNIYSVMAPIVNGRTQSQYKTKVKKKKKKMSSNRLNNSSLSFYWFSTAAALFVLICQYYVAFTATVGSSHAQPRDCKEDKIYKYSTRAVFFLNFIRLKSILLDCYSFDCQRTIRLDIGRKTATSS